MKTRLSAGAGRVQAALTAAPKSFSLLIKPASADCNLRCDYCFYLDKASLYPHVRVHRMPDDTLERVVRTYMATAQPVYAFVWQGGEPTLMGAAFFERVTDLQMRCGGPGTQVANALQTNATLVTDELARHLARYRFLVGVSIDGPAELHDRFRHRRNGGGSHGGVIAGLARLQAGGVACNALTLVSKANVRHAARVYDHLLDLGLTHHQYIPCVEFDARGRPRPWTITPAEWGQFLIAIHRRWLPRDTTRVSLRHADALLNLMVSNRRTMCTLSHTCGDYFVVEHNGDVYPCDFFVTPDLRLGNVGTHTWPQLAADPRAVRFNARKRQWSRVCERCEFLTWCAGDCPRHRRNGDRRPSWLCDGWRTYYRCALPDLGRLAEHLKRSPAGG